MTHRFFLYGPQAPTAFSNGPSCTQFQAEFVEEVMKRAQKEGITRFEATKDAEGKDQLLSCAEPHHTDFHFQMTGANV